MTDLLTFEVNFFLGLDKSILVSCWPIIMQENRLDEKRSQKEIGDDGG